MKLKDLLLVAWAYIAWNAVASIYNSKKWDTIKQEIVEDKDNALKIIWNNIIDINKKLFNEVKEEVQNIDTEDLKEKTSNLIEEFKIKSKDLINKFDNIKEKSPEYISDISNKIEDLYNEKKDLIDSYKKEIPNFVSEWKEKLLAYFEEIKKEIKK